MRNFIIVIIMMMISVPVLAQDDSGRFGMNWCDIGGPLEGTCTIPGDEALTNYMWELGWYLAAVDRHEILEGDIPDRYINTGAGVDEETSPGGSDKGYKCKSIKLPNLPDNAATVTGELVHRGTTYQSATIPSATYETFAAGEKYDPATVGRKHKVRIISKDAGGDVIKSKTYKFHCKGEFDPTAGGIFPGP